MHRLLIANRGEIVSRIIRSAHELNLEVVAVYSDADRDLPSVSEADYAVALRGNHPGVTYLNIDALIAAAHAMDADAVHPGYGFLSESASFAQAVIDAGLTFIGPTPQTIASMGSKTHAKRTMDQAGVPVLPSVEVSPSDNERFDPTVAAHLPLPLLVKASYGGGGRGMRVVTTLAELPEAVVLASHEAASAFGDGTVFIEPLVVDPHHIEVQILGDAYGNYTHLFERECSIQRRYQKIIEESPSPTVTAALREELTDAAVAAAQAISYLGVGTVEFIVTGAGSFYFLEVNTRLQVEHGVTELVTGVDLVRAQLEIAQGKELSPVVLNASQRGHAFEVRLYAEAPADDYRPQAGKLTNFLLSEGPGVRVDRGFRSGNVVSPYYDAMLAKILSWGETRTEAIERLSDTLRSSMVTGVETNLDLLSGIVQEPQFCRGEIDTGYLKRHDPTTLISTQQPTSAVLPRLLAAATVALADRVAKGRAAQRSIPFGWRNVTTSDQSFELLTQDEQQEIVSFRFSTPSLLNLTYGGHGYEVKILALEGSALSLEVEGIRQSFAVFIDDDFIHVSDGHYRLTRRMRPRLHSTENVVPVGSVVAPMPSTVVRVAVTDNEVVAKGSVLMTVEAMKMQYDIVAPTDGTVHKVLTHVGDQLKHGEIVIDFQAHEGT
jgi:acetyl/propionyl-CoA carboxylase alpha subunit